MDPELKEMVLRLLIREEQNQFPDKIIVGTPSKGGEVTIHCNFDRPEETKERIGRAIDARNLAVQLHSQTTTVTSGNGSPAKV